VFIVKFDSLEEAIDYLRWLSSGEPEEPTEEQWRWLRKADA
jgi:hypothetical protein